MPTTDPTKDARGFCIYATVKDDRGATLDVKESSAANGPHVWLFTESGHVYQSSLPGSGSMHLNAEQAARVRDALTAFLDQIPHRWGPLEADDATD